MFVGLGELQFQDVFCIRHLHRKLEEYLSEHSLGTQPAETPASCLTVFRVSGEEEEGIFIDIYRERCLLDQHSK